MYHFKKSLRLLPESVRKIFGSKEVSKADKTELVHSVIEHTSDGKHLVNPNALVHANLFGDETISNESRCVIIS